MQKYLQIFWLPGSTTRNLRIPSLKKLNKMFVTETPIRIHYALTDQMGMVYYGHYAQFYEIGRTEAIRQIGYTYKEIEALGIIMPVVEIHSKFLRPAKYDDLIT